MSDLIDLFHDSMRVVGHAVRAADASHQSRAGQHALEFAGEKLIAAITVQQRTGRRLSLAQFCRQCATC